MRFALVVALVAFTSSAFAQQGQGVNPFFHGIVKSHATVPVPQPTPVGRPAANAYGMATPAEDLGSPYTACGKMTEVFSCPGT